MSTNKIESGLQLFSRLNQRPSLQNINPMLFYEGPYPNDVIEIAGGSGTGKTLLIMDFLTRSLLPKEYNGKHCGAIIINTDHHFDLFRLIEMMDSFIQKYSSRKVSQAVVEEVIQNALNSLIVLNCYDYHQLQITFLNLEKVLSDNNNIGLVAIDSISSYYWEYRNINNTIISIQNYHTKVLESLQLQLKNSNLVIIFSRNEFELKLDVCWKIVLKEHENRYQAMVVNNKKNDNGIINFVIEKTIKFLN